MFTYIEKQNKKQRINKRNPEKHRRKETYLINDILTSLLRFYQVYKYPLFSSY